MKTSALFVHTPPLALLFCATLFAGGCSSITSDDIQDLGSTNTNNLTVEPPPTEPFYAPYSDFYGTWVGEATDPLAFGAGSGSSAALYHFPSGSTQIVLTLGPDDEMDGVPVGTFTFGAGEPPAPPTDPNVGYPVSYVDLLGSYSGGPMGLIGDTMPLPPIEGFVYDAYSGVLLPEAGEFGGVADGVLRLSVGTHQVLEPWCALQTPIESQSTPGVYRCVPEPDQYGYGYDAATDTCTLGQSLAVVDCDKLYLCAGGFDGSGRCECDDSQCFPAVSSILLDEVLDFNLRRTGSTLTGVVTDKAFLNERGLRVPLTLTLQRVE